MQKQLIAFDPLNGISQYHHYDADTDTSYFESVGDPTDALDFNKKLANNQDLTKHGFKEGWWWYASIPVIIQLKLLTEHGIDCNKKEHLPRLSKILEHPDYRYLKVTDKKHIISAHD